MKANEFVKKFGWGEARKIVDGHKFAFHPSFKHWSIKHNDYYLVERDYTVAIADLKRLVESWELVEEFGDDISYLKSHLSKCPTVITHFYLESWNQTFTRERLEKAIADVESCL